ncbi:MAG: hypothetical protein DRM98_04975 [Thermoplasmata archaeon]|nr:MAG: hypothetical protein DRM98_04975 [Thermoplasmata archaeon]
MWLITSAIVAVTATMLWYFKDDGRYKLEVLSLIFWGTTIMVFVDHMMGYFNDVIAAGLEAGEFVEVSWQAFMLSILLVCIGIGLWEAYLIYKNPKKLTQ